MCTPLSRKLRTAAENALAWPSCGGASAIQKMSFPVADVASHDSWAAWASARSGTSGKSPPPPAPSAASPAWYAATLAVKSAWRTTYSSPSSR